MLAWTQRLMLFWRGNYVVYIFGV